MALAAEAVLGGLPAAGGDAVAAVVVEQAKPG